MTPDEIAVIITQAAQRHGVPTEALMAIANIESSGNIAAQNPRSSASGLFQFVDTTAREYGLTGDKRNDPVAQADAAAKMMATNANALSRTLGRPANAGELYLAHQQGLGGAKALLTNPGRPAVDVLAGVYGSREKAARAIQLNGGSLNQSAGQFSGQWVNKANQRVAMIPPGSIPNVVASQLDTTPQTRNVPLPQPRPQRMVQGTSQAPTSAASRAFPTQNATPRLAPQGDGIFAYSPPDMQPAQITPGMGSLTPDFFRPQPQVRLPTLPPSNLASSRTVNASIERANAAVDPGLQAALARRVAQPGMVETSMARAANAVDPALQRALEARNAVGVGQPPATRVVPSTPVSGPANGVGQMPEFAQFLSQFGPIAKSVPGPNAAPKNEARLPPGVRDVGAITSVPPQRGMPIQVVPSVATQTATARPVVGFPTPANQRPAQMKAQRTVGFPTPANIRPSMAMAQPQQAPLRVTVQGANSYTAPQPRYVSTTGQALQPRQTVRYNTDTNSFEPVTLYEPVKRQERRSSISGPAQSLV